MRPGLSFVLFALALLTTTASAQELTVATKVTPPFVTKAEDGTWSGLSIELWKMIAARMGTTSKFVEHDLESMLEATRAGSVDVAVAAITVTEERQETLEFSHPFLSSGLGIATRGEETGMVAAVTDRLFSMSLLQALMALLLVLSVCGVVVWLFERKTNPEEFGGKGIKGIGSGFWFSAVTMTTVGYGDKSPKTLGGRAVALIWMFTSIVIISSYTAAIASALTVESMNTAVRDPDDLATARIGTVRSSAAETWLRDEHLSRTPFADLDAAMDALEQGRLDAVVYDAPILQSMTLDRDAIQVLPHVLRQASYAFVLPLDSELRKPINRALLHVLESNDWIALHDKYLGQ